MDKVLAMVNGKPYLYIEERIDRDSVPEGLVMYEAADCRDGRLSRISDRILVNFVNSPSPNGAVPRQRRK